MTNFVYRELNTNKTYHSFTGIKHKINYPVQTIFDFILYWLYAVNYVVIITIRLFIHDEVAQFHVRISHIFYHVIFISLG